MTRRSTTATTINAGAAWAWGAVAETYARMTMDAAEVIARRSLKLSTGAMSASEAVGMATEKATAFAESSQRAASAAVRGGDPAQVAAAALAPYAKKARANARRYRAAHS